MTITVSKKPGGITQLFNTKTGRVTYKCKADSAFMLIEAFGGIVKFHQKGAIATVTGALTSIENCSVIKTEDSEYKDALSAVISAEKEFAKNISNELQQNIEELEKNYLSLNS